MSEPITFDSEFCPKLPQIPEVPSITLPFGGELTAFADASLGIPDICSMRFSLILQLTPMLASIQCLIEVLGVIDALKKFATSPLTQASDLLKAIEKVAECIVSVTPPFPHIVLTIQGSIELIFGLLDNCLIEKFDELTKIQERIIADMDTAVDNPVLLATLKCKQENVQGSMSNLMRSLEPIKPLIALLVPLCALAQMNEIKKTLEGIAQGLETANKKPGEILSSLKEAKKSLTAAKDSAQSVAQKAQEEVKQKEEAKRKAEEEAQQTSGGQTNQNPPLPPPLQLNRPTNPQDPSDIWQWVTDVNAYLLDLSSWRQSVIQAAQTWSPVQPPELALKAALMTAPAKTVPILPTTLKGIPQEAK